ncbi:MAG: SCO family protein [Methylotenera sp.]
MQADSASTVNLRRRAIIGAALACLISPALWAKNQKWLTQPVLDELRLLDQDGKSWRLFEDLIRGRVVVVNFIFTGCVNVCPPQTALLRELRKQLNAADSREVMLLSLTVDPLHDQPQQLREFAGRYDISLGAEHGWLMLTGAMRDMKQALSAFGANTLAPDEHPALLWIGNEPRQRWTRTSSLNPPQTLLRLINEVQA